MKQHITPITYCVIAISLFLFFAFGYWGHMNYHEQLQMFSNTWSYIAGLLKYAGGVNDIFARWLTQWYFNHWIGSIIASFVCTLFAFCIAKTKKHNPIIAVSSALLLLGLQFIHKDQMMAGATAMLFVEIFILIENRLTAQKLQQPSDSIRRIILSIILSIIAGPYAALIFVICTIRKWYEIIPPFLVMIVYKIFVYYQAPLIAHFMGTEYFRYVTQFVWEPFGIGGFIILINYSDRIKWSKFIQWGLSLIVICYTIYNIYDKRDEELILKFDKLARFHKWEQIIELSEKHSKKYKMIVMYTNLALVHTERIGNELFKHNQFGVEGLIPNYDKGVDINLVSSEIFYHLGMINSAERCAFECQEAIPDDQKSVRAIKRLAQCNIIKEDYDVARRYLAMLKETYTYRRWALQAEEYINANQTNGVMEWATIRARMPKNDNFYTVQQYDKVLMMLVKEAESFKYAYDYLLSYVLLKKDVDQFMEIFRPQRYTKGIPRYYNEAYLYYVGSKNPEALNNISQMDRQLLSRMQEFIKILKANNNDPRIDNYKDLYLWYIANR